MVALAFERCSSIILFDSNIILVIAGHRWVAYYYGAYPAIVEPRSGRSRWASSMEEVSRLFRNTSSRSFADFVVIRLLPKALNFCGKNQEYWWSELAAQLVGVRLGWLLWAPARNQVGNGKNLPLTGASAIQRDLLPNCLLVTTMS